MVVWENSITFRVTRQGEVLYSPEIDIQSTSYGDNLQKVLREIAPQVAKYFEGILKEKFVGR